MKRTRGGLAAAVGVLGCLLVAAACAGGTTPATSDQGGAGGAEGGDLVVARALDVQSLDSDAIATSRQGWETYNLIAQPLYTGDDKGALQPLVAESHTVGADKLTWTFALREGVKFSNGDPVTSADVKFTLEHAQKGALQGAVYQAITSITTPDPRTVVLKTATPNSGLLSDLTGYAVAIIPKDFAGMSEKEFWRDPVGSGPFMVDSWQQGKEIKLVPNPEYWGDEPRVRSISFRPVSDENTRMLQLQNGEADLVEDVPYAQIATVKANPDLRLTELPYPTSIFLTLNTAKPPFDDRHARRAVSLAIDRAKVLQAALLGYGKPAGSFIDRSSLGGYAPKFGLTHDLTAAKRELAASATPEGFSFEILYPASGSDLTSAVQVIQANLAELGITVKLNGTDQDTIFAKRKSGKWDASTATIISGGDAGSTLQYYASTSGFNSASELIPSVEAGWKKSQLNFEPGGRLAIYRDLLTTIAEDAPQIGLYSPPRLYASQAGVRSIVAVDTTGALDFTRITAAP